MTPLDSSASSTQDSSSQDGSAHDTSTHDTSVHDASTRDASSHAASGHAASVLDPETGPETDSSSAPVPGAPAPGSVDELGERIAELSAYIQAATYRLLVMLREFDERDGWSVGFRSCAHWLNWRTGLDLGAAREKVRVARALAELPVLSAAMERGEISYSKVRALTRVATPDTEEELLHIALDASASQVEKLVRATRRVERLIEREQEEHRHQGRYVQISSDEDGMVVVRARLTAEAGAALQRALEAAQDRLYETARQDPATAEVEPQQQRADALALVAESALASGLDPGTRGDRYQVVVHVEAEALRAGSEAGAAALQDGPDVSAETSRRLACDAAKVEMVEDADGSVLDVGRRTRTVPAALRRALERRDGGCRFPGCGIRFCEAHHVEHWADGGATKLDNLLQLCRHHHRAVHEAGFTVELLPGGEARFQRPDGRVLHQAPPLPPVERDPVERFEEMLADDGLEIDAFDKMPSGGDDNADYAGIVAWLMSQRPAPGEVGTLD